MKSITVRNINEDLDKALQENRKKTGKSINTIIIETLEESLTPRKRNREKRYHDLDHLAGTWSEEEANQFREATEIFDKIDEELWK